MAKPTRDPNRTGVQAKRLSEWPDDGYAEPGGFVAFSSAPPALCFACPGCGQLGSIRCGRPKPKDRPSWDVVSGTLGDPATLTLAPSINCAGCCGWHGYLRNGVFESC